MKKLRGMEDKNCVKQLINEEAKQLCAYNSVRSTDKNLSYLSNLSTYKKVAFTLAEVLITLGIIGIVAALTMPALITKYQKKQTLTKLKKTYSTLNQAFKLSEIENGEFESWEFSGENKPAFVNKYWAPYFNGVHKCYNYTDCGYKTEKPWKSTLNGNALLSYPMPEETNDNFVALLLADGTYVDFRSNEFIVIDINGSKGPNVVGKDAFTFTVNKRGLAGACPTFTKEQVMTRCSSNDSLVCCSRRIIEFDNWQITDDYPW